MSDTLIGRTLGQYRIVEEIGVGGMATVYKAYQPNLNRYVAVEVLPPLHAKQPGFTERFRREAEAVANLNHPNILPVFDFGQEESYSFIAMRYVEGARTLKEVMATPLDLTQVADLIAQIAAALDCAHRQGVIHRDVKPSNVMMDGDWALLTDFGLARMTEMSVKPKGPGTGLTGSGVGIGTPAYMSPEQGQGLEIDHRTDVYSLGIILFEMLTGQIPHDAETPLAIVLKRITGPLPLPRAINPDIPELVERVILKALAREPKDRFASAGTMADALKQAVSEPAVAEAEEPSMGYLEVEPLPAEEEAAAIEPKPPTPTSTDTATPTPTSTPEPASTATPTFTATPHPPTETPKPTPTNTPLPPTPSLKLGDTWTRPIDGMVMIYVPAGEFEMGSTEGDNDEQPVHTVTLDGFWIDRTEVTNAQYRKCVDAGACSPPYSSGSYTRDRYYSNPEYDDYPVVHVDWHQAQKYAAWVGGRLPTEAEWEYAARGPDGYTYPWGNGAPNDSLLNYNDNVGDTTAVGSYPDGASWCGALDMAGNVWELVADWYDSGYYANSPDENPLGLDSGDLRVLRGGSLYSGYGIVRCARRGRNDPDGRDDDGGFRVARGSP